MCLFKRNNLYDITYEVMGFRKRTIVEAKNIAKAIKKVQKKHSCVITIVDWEVVG